MCKASSSKRRFVREGASWIHADANIKHSGLFIELTKASTRGSGNSFLIRLLRSMTFNPDSSGISSSETVVSVSSSTLRSFRALIRNTREAEVGTDFRFWGYICGELATNLPAPSPTCTPSSRLLGQFSFMAHPSIAKRVTTEFSILLVQYKLWCESLSQALFTLFVLMRQLDWMWAFAVAKNESLWPVGALGLIWKWRSGFGLNLKSFEKIKIGRQHQVWHEKATPADEPPPLERSGFGCLFSPERVV